MSGLIWFLLGTFFGGTVVAVPVLSIRRGHGWGRRSQDHLDYEHRLARFREHELELTAAQERANSKL